MNEEDRSILPTSGRRLILLHAQCELTSDAFGTWSQNTSIFTSPRLLWSVTDCIAAPIPPLLVKPRQHNTHMPHEQMRGVGVAVSRGDPPSACCCSLCVSCQQRM